jgi:hypothetical protein
VLLRLNSLDQSVRSEPRLVRLLLPGLNKVAEAAQRHLAMIRTLGVALAAERYRLKHGSWPHSAEALVPTFLDSVPEDPYSGTPIRFLWRDGGVVAYSVGTDGKDNRATFNRELPTAPGSDIGVQLWPVSRRGW